jgi:arylsulfatase A-like enzyme
MQPNIVLILADDLGVGQVGYNDHPWLSTPNIDAIASGGVRFDKFYSSGPQCSPTRASILTGRAPDRSGVFKHSYPLRTQEKTIAQVLRDNGYATGHFGKWHLNGLQGLVGAPILTTDPYGPGPFGFDEWFSNLNNIAWGGQMGDHTGAITEIAGDTSEAIADKANSFIEANASGPFFAAVWFSSPHDPFTASAADKVGFETLDEDLQNHLGEIVAMDRAIGTIRQKLRDLNIEDNTVVWFVSDNGGLGNVDPDASGGLRGQKNDMYEGGIRVPCAAEWPGTWVPGVSNQLAYTSDLPATFAQLAGATSCDLTQPQDGVSLCDVLLNRSTIPGRCLIFYSMDRAALVTDQWKLVTSNASGGYEISFHVVTLGQGFTNRVGRIAWELYDIVGDPLETTDLADQLPCVVARANSDFLFWQHSVRCSLEGLDYEEKGVVDEPFTIWWPNSPLYANYVTAWSSRPEYASTYAAAGL